MKGHPLGLKLQNGNELSVYLRRERGSGFWMNNVAGWEIGPLMPKNKKRSGLRCQGRIPNFVFNCFTMYADGFNPRGFPRKYPNDHTAKPSPSHNPSFLALSAKPIGALPLTRGNVFLFLRSSPEDSHQKNTCLSMGGGYFR